MAVVLLAAWLSRGWLSVAVAETLVCSDTLAPSDAILVENLEADYLMFERAAELRTAALATRVLVPLQTNRDHSAPSAVALGTAEVMARIARLGAFEIVPIQLVEPISLHAAHDVRRYLEREGIRSVIVVAPLFRSKRSMLVYAATLGRAGITVRCAPVQGTRGVDTWTASWHGVQQVAEQWVKLAYYRLYVLPFRLDAREPGD
jgi:hypothetical protein